MKILISTLRINSKCTYMTFEKWCKFILSTWLRLTGDTSQPVCISQTGNRLWTTSSNMKFLVNITPQLSKGIISKLYNLLLQNLWSRHRLSFHTYLLFLMLCVAFIIIIWPLLVLVHVKSEGPVVPSRSEYVVMFLENFSSDSKILHGSPSPYKLHFNYIWYLLATRLYIYCWKQRFF